MEGGYAAPAPACAAVGGRAAAEAALAAFGNLIQVLRPCHPQAKRAWTASCLIRGAMP